MFPLLDIFIQDYLHIVQIVDGVVDLLFLDDEAVFQVDDEVEVVEEEVGKKSDLFLQLYLHFF